MYRREAQNVTKKSPINKKTLNNKKLSTDARIDYHFLDVVKVYPVVQHDHHR